MSRDEFHDWLSERLGLVTLVYYENVMTYVAMAVETAKFPNKSPRVAKEANPLAISPGVSSSESVSAANLGATSESNSYKERKKKKKKAAASSNDSSKKGVASKKTVGKNKVMAYSDML